MTTATTKTTSGLSHNYSVKPVKNIEQTIAYGPGTVTITYKGYGLWDNEAQAWVSFSRCKRTGAPLVYALPRRYLMQQVVTSGLNGTYELVKA